MKKMRMIWILGLLLLLLPVLPAGAVETNELEIQVTASAETVTPGETFTLTVSLENYTGTDPIRGVEVTVGNIDGVHLTVVDQTSHLESTTALTNTVTYQEEENMAVQLFLEKENTLPVITKDLMTLTLKASETAKTQTTITLPVTARIKTQNAKIERTVDCTVKQVGLFALYGASVALNNNLDMKFFFAMNHIADWSGHYVEVVHFYTDGRPSAITRIPVSEWKTNNGYYEIVYGGIAAKNMSDQVILTVYNEEGQPVSEPWIDGIRDYTERIFDKADVKLKTLLVDMLNYGSEAQKYFSYAIDDLANSHLTAEQKSYASELESVKNNRIDLGNGYFYGSNLSLDSNIKFNFFFEGITSDMYAIISYTNYRGRVMEHRVAATDFDKNNEKYYVLVDDNLVVADARQLVSITLYDVHGNSVGSVMDSMESYVNRINMDVARAFMKYADSARDYLLSN